MSARLPSRWLFAAGLLAAGGLNSAALAQAPPSSRVADLPPAVAVVLPRLLAEPLLLEQEQVSEHGDMPLLVRPAVAPAPRVVRGCGLPECQTSADEVMFRCLLFSVNPLSVFIPIHTGVPEPDMTLPSDRYLEPAAERIDVMPEAVEEIGAMPDVEERYEFLAPVADFARSVLPTRLPLTEIKVGVGEAPTGSLRFGVGIELSQTGTFAVSAEVRGTSEEAEPIPVMPREEKAAEAVQVQIDAVVAEVDNDAARNIGLGVAANPDHAEHGTGFSIDHGRSLVLYRHLCETRKAHVLSQPTFVTRDGQRADFFSGSEVAVPAADGEGLTVLPCGVQLRLMPRVTEQGSIHLRMSATLSRHEGGGSLSDYQSRSISTEIEMRAGQTLSVGVHQGGKSFVLVLVTPRIIEPPTAAGAVAESVHDLLVKCQRELSRGHYAAAEDLAQQALGRDRQQVEADPLVYKFNLLQQVKERAALPLGTAEPCGAKAECRCAVPQGESKAVGSRERMVEALLQEFNSAYKEGRFRDAQALAGQALELDPNDARAVAALMVARNHARPRPQAEPTAAALARFQDDYKAGRFEEARIDALEAMALAPGYPPAVSALQMAYEALLRQPPPESPTQCPYVGTGLRPALPSVDPAVVSALRKILLDGDKGPVGGVEEAEPHDATRRAPR